MARHINRKCKHCASLPIEEAIALHNDQGDGCWNPRDILQLGYDCHRRRHHYRYRTAHNAARRRARRRDRQVAFDAQTQGATDVQRLMPSSVPQVYASVLVLYRQSETTPVHAVAAEVWLGDRQVAGIPAVHCMGMRGDEVSDYIRQMLTLLQQQFGIFRFEDVIKEVPVQACPIVPCPYMQD